MDVHVNAERFERAAVSLIAHAVRHTLATQGAPDGEVSVTLLDDEGIRALNREYLGRDRATDVIAFSLGDAETLGDVYIGYQRGCAQAAELGIDPDEEIVRLAIHGTLHVLGHEHPEGPERSESPMFVLQERLLGEVLAAG